MLKVNEAVIIKNTLLPEAVKWILGCYANTHINYLILQTYLPLHDCKELRRANSDTATRQKNINYCAPLLLFTIRKPSFICGLTPSHVGNHRENIYVNLALASVHSQSCNAVQDKGGKDRISFCHYCQSSCCLVWFYYHWSERLSLQSK